jgi:hypothetical protein
MSDGSQMRLDDNEMTTSLSVISYNFPNMIDESEGTFTNFTSSNLSGGNQTTSSITSYRSFITSSNYYNINNDLKVSEHAYLFSSGSNDYWSWRKPSDIQVGDYLLGQNKEIRQVSSSEHIVSGTLGLSQINVEDVDTLFVNGYLVHNGFEDEGGGGGGAAVFSIVNQSASIHLNTFGSRSPYLNHLEQDSIELYDTSFGPSPFDIHAGITLSSGTTGTAQNLKLGIRTSNTSDDFTYIQTTLGAGDNGLGSPLSGSGTTNRNITTAVSGFDLSDPGAATNTPDIKRAPIVNGSYSFHAQFTSSTNSTFSTFQTFYITGIITKRNISAEAFYPNDLSGTTTGSDGQVIGEETSLKHIREIMEQHSIASARPNYSPTDSSTQDGVLAGSGFSPGGNREQETFSLSEAHSASFVDGVSG